MLDYERSFIEVQFPVSKVSKESYKERMAGASQTLTGLGKWWGKKTPPSSCKGCNIWCSFTCVQRLRKR